MSCGIAPILGVRLTLGRVESKPKLQVTRNVSTTGLVPGEFSRSPETIMEDARTEDG